MFVQTATRIAPVARTAVSIKRKFTFPSVIDFLHGFDQTKSMKFSWMAINGSLFSMNIKCFDDYKRKLLN